jgi:hypothetical protein
MGLTAFLAIVAGCSPGAQTSAWPDTPLPPAGWSSLGSVSGESAGGEVVRRFTFSGRALAVNASCRGSGTLFVIVDWPGVSLRSGPASFSTTAFPCASPADSQVATQVELATALTGDADVNIFVVESPGSAGRTSYAVSIEERDP